VSCNGFSRDVACSLWLTLALQRNAPTSRLWFRLRFRVCKLESPLQETNGPPLLSNSQIAVASELKNNPEEQCIALQYIVTTSHLIRDLRKADLNFNQIKKTK
jgi:hypothetical protein